jgi:hypothetical protein
MNRYLYRSERMYIYEHPSFPFGDQVSASTIKAIPLFFFLHYR